MSASPVVQIPHPPVPAAGAPAAGGPAPARAVVVIDTNAVLDCLLFRDPSVTALAAALRAGALAWIATPRMLDELAQVLPRPAFDRWGAQREAALADAHRLCTVVPAPEPAAAGRLWCSDADDQPFIDLALAHPARWLLSRDRALLRLARAARRHGVQVLAPAAWAPD